MGSALTGSRLLRDTADTKNHNISVEPNAVSAVVPGRREAKVFNLPHGEAPSAISSFSSNRACASLT